MTFEPVFTTRSRRATFRIVRGASTIEAALDDAVVEARERSTAFCELELELVAGDERDLFPLARELAQAAPLRVGVLAKSARGLALAEAEGRGDCVKAKGSPLARGMSVERAFLAILADCVRQFRLNEDIILADPGENAIHQARVSLRRLRSAFTLFRPAIADAASRELAEGLKWLAGELGAARDLDVLIGEEKEARERGAAPSSGLPALLQANRDEAYASADSALRSSRALALMLDLAEWAAVGAWRSAPETAEAREADVAAFAAAVLKKRFGALMKRSKGLAALDAESRHEARKDAKKLRYASDFFEPLFGAKRFGEFADDLAALQDTLGELNDIASQREATADLAQTADDASAAYAAGMLAGQAEARAPALLRKAGKRRAKLKAAKKFWKR